MEVSGELHAPTALPPWREPPARWICGWVSPRAGLPLLEIETPFNVTPARGPSLCRFATWILMHGSSVRTLLHLPRVASHGRWRSESVGLIRISLSLSLYIYIYESISVTGRGVPLGCEKSRLPHILDNRLTDGGKVVTLTSRPLFTPKKIPGTHFCYRLSRPQDHGAAGRIRSIKKSNNLIGNWSCDLPACQIWDTDYFFFSKPNQDSSLY
jgi:hypothetical protein